jgi:hypothetical protein
LTDYPGHIRKALSCVYLRGVMLCSYGFVHTGIFRVYFVIPHQEFVCRRNKIAKFDLEYLLNLFILLDIMFMSNNPVYSLSHTKKRV